MNIQQQSYLNTNSFVHWIAPGFLVPLVFLIGCGTTTQRAGTEQLLISDAVDMAVSQMDFRPLQDQRVYLDTTYLNSVKSIGFVNAPYIISSLRQQLTAAGCLLQENRKDADIVMEARVGALGTNGHEITYGLPQSSALSTAASMFSNGAPVPAIPEISAARVDAQSGIAKLFVFAYDRQTRHPVWQSGVAKAESTSRNSWVFGAGPFQRGTVHKGVRFAGSKISAEEKQETNIDYRPPAPYFSKHLFGPPEASNSSKRIAESPNENTGGKGTLHP